MSSRYQKAHAQSQVLSDIENENIFTALGRGCQSLSTAVVELYLADATNKQEWNKRCCGVACFVKDNPQRSYFIRLFDPKTSQMVWEQELYIQFAYKTPNEHFHTFEADDCQAGLNFASETEAADFKKMVDFLLTEREQKYKERQKQNPGNRGNSGGSNQPINVGLTVPPAQVNLTTVKPNNTLKNDPQKKDKGTKGRKKLTNEDISWPAYFTHVSHVGWDPYTGLDMQKLDPEMKKGKAQHQSRRRIVSPESGERRIYPSDMAIERRRRAPPPPPEMGDIADVPSPCQVRRHVQSRPTPPPEIEFQYASELSSQGAMSGLEKSADVFPIPQYVAGRRFVRPESGERHIFPSDKTIEKRRRVPHTPPEMGDIADITHPAPGRRFGRAFQSGELDIFLSDEESNNSTVDGISPGKANTSSELQKPLLQDCAVVDNEALYE